MNCLCHVYVLYYCITYSTYSSVTYNYVNNLQITRTIQKNIGRILRILCIKDNYELWRRTYLELADDSTLVVLYVAGLLTAGQFEGVQPLLEAVEVGHTLQVVGVYLHVMRQAKLYCCP